MTFTLKEFGFLSIILFSYLLINLFTTALADECLSKIEPKQNCTVTIKTSGKNDFGVVHISALNLRESDLFTVQIGNDSKNVKGLSSGLIVLPFQEKYIFSVNTSTDGGNRYQKIETLGQHLSVTELSSFTILIKQGISNLKPFLNFMNDDEKSIVLTTTNKGVTATSFVNGKSNLTVNLDEKDFLTNHKKFKLEFEIKDKNIDNIYHFNLLKTSRSCSEYKTVEETIELKTFDKKTEYTSEAYTCVYLLKSKDEKTNLQVDKFDFKTINEYDFIKIKDGQKLSSNDLINTRTKDASSYLNNLEKTLSSSASLMVILSSKFIPDGYEQSVVTIKKSNIKKLDKEGDFDFTTDKETIFVFSLNDKYPVLNFGKNLNLVKTNLSVYYGMDLSTAPVMQFFENEIVNSEIWSEKKTIVLKFTSSSPLAVKGKLMGTAVNCNKLSNHPSTFFLNGSQYITNQSCHFYFKPNDIVHSITLNLENVLLFQSACLELKSVKEAKVYFEICNKNPAIEELAKIHLPELILPYADSYILTYKEGENFKSKLLVQASFAFNSQPPFKNTTLTKENPTCDLSSYNYPYSYPFVLAKEIHVFNSDKYVYGSFEKYDLRKNDVLKMFSETNFKFNFTNGTVDDFIFDSQKTGIAFSLISNLNLSASLLESEFSQGYLINLERFECNLELNSKDLSIKTPNYPGEFNQSKCIAIIDLSDKDKGHYLNLTIKNAKAINYGHLTIYDSSTRHRSSELAHVFDSNVLKNNETINFNTSSTKLVLIYDTLGKQVNGFELKIEKKDCPENFTCDDKTRCVLKSIRCNYVTECLDSKDEYGCSPNPNPIPPNPIPPNPEVITRGLSGWVIVFVIIPLSMMSGAAMILHGPRLIARLRTPRSYQEFNTFSENA